jgi:predicted HTH domain antitoxin
MKANESESIAESTFQVRLPASLLQFGLSPEDVQQRLTEWIVLSLFVEGRISSGKAARLLNIARSDFLDLLHARGMAYINYTPDELAEEFEAVTQLEAQSQSNARRPGHGQSPGLQM